MGTQMESGGASHRRVEAEVGCDSGSVIRAGGDESHRAEQLGVEGVPTPLLTRL
jgi:hypothetical protein